MTKLKRSDIDTSKITKQDAADAIRLIVHRVALIETTKGKPQALALKERLEAMSMDELTTWFLDIANKRTYVPFSAPNFSSDNLDIENNFKIAKDFGVDFFENIVLKDRSSDVTYCTNEKYMVIDIPVRRQVQTSESSISVPGTKVTTDDLTNQPVGDANKARITTPEISGLAARDMKATLHEFLSVRGGNLKAMNTLDRDIIESGHGSLEAVLADGSRAKITDSLSTILTSMHIENNI